MNSSSTTPERGSKILGYIALFFQSITISILAMVIFYLFAYLVFGGKITFEIIINWDSWKFLVN